jgi:hypothetical protein
MIFLEDHIFRRLNFHRCVKKLTELEEFRQSGGKNAFSFMSNYATEH